MVLFSRIIFQKITGPLIFLVFDPMKFHMIYSQVVVFFRIIYHKITGPLTCLVFDPMKFHMISAVDVVVLFFRIIYRKVVDPRLNLSAVFHAFSLLLCRRMLLPVRSL